ncbi:hypothetical protein GQ600_20370 [Phytophthora cactorum]|nr:hypothetical protein GQ600_20370 [Phytophthora cactorum]
MSTRQSREKGTSGGCRTSLTDISEGRLCTSYVFHMPALPRTVPSTQVRHVREQVVPEAMGYGPALQRLLQLSQLRNHRRGAQDSSGWPCRPRGCNGIFSHTKALRRVAQWQRRVQSVRALPDSSCGRERTK